MTSALTSLRAGSGALASTLRPMESGDGAGPASPPAGGALPKPIPAAGAGASRAATGQLLGASLQGGQGGVKEFQAQQARWEMEEWQRDIVPQDPGAGLAE